jgi:hypothetical protein
VFFHYGLAVQRQGCPYQAAANSIGQLLVFNLLVFDLPDDYFGSGCPVHFDTFFKLKTNWLLPARCGAFWIVSGINQRLFQIIKSYHQNKSPIALAAWGFKPKPYHKSMSVLGTPTNHCVKVTHI